MEEPLVAESARKHGLDVNDILHAHPQPHPGLGPGDGFTMVVGASATGAILEVGHVRGATADIIVHAMRARKKFLR
ncbi:MAG: hypothetical protein ACRCYR_13270 [Phycicoccus sp.]